MATKDVAVRLIANVDSYRKGMQEASKSTDQLATTTTATTSAVGSKWGAAGAMISSSMGLSVAAVGAGLVMLGKTSVDAASNLSESMNAVNVSYGESADAVHKLGTASVDSFGLSRRAFNEAAVGFTSFAEDVAGDGGNVAATLETLMLRSTDFASVMNMDVTEAADAFKSALAGEAEPLKRFGINISDAATKAYALRTGLIDVGREMTDQEKIQARYGLLMEETAKTAGDFANTSSGYANSMKKMKAEVENLSASLGVLLLPVLASVVGGIADLANQAQDFGDRIRDIPGVVYFAKTIADIPSTLNDFENALWGAAGNLTGINAEAEATHGTFTGFAEGVAHTGEVVNTFAGDIQYAGEGVDEWRASHERLIGPLQSETETIYGVISAIKQQITATTDSVTALVAETQAVEAVIDARRKSTDTIYAAEDAEDAWWVQIQETTAALADAELGDRQKAASLRDLATATDRQATLELEAQGVNLKTVAGQQKWIDKMMAVANSLEGPQRDAILGHIALVSGIPVSKLTTITVDTSAAMSAASALDRHLNNVARTRFATIAPNFSGIPVYADGTNFHPGGMAMVGEEGPELVSLPRGSKVYTAAQTANMTAVPQSFAAPVAPARSGSSSPLARDLVFNTTEPVSVDTVSRAIRLARLAA